MIVHTHSEKVMEARKTILELLLANHPLDCLTCEKVVIVNYRIIVMSTVLPRQVSRVKSMFLSLTIPTLILLGITTSAFCVVNVCELAARLKVQVSLTLVREALILK